MTAGGVGEGEGDVAQTHLSLKLSQNLTKPMGSHGDLPQLENTGISDEQQGNLFCLFTRLLHKMEHCSSYKSWRCVLSPTSNVKLHQGPDC